MNEEKYYQLVMDLISRHKSKIKEIYYLLLYLIIRQNAIYFPRYPHPFSSKESTFYRSFSPRIPSTDLNPLDSFPDTHDTGHAAIKDMTIMGTHTLKYVTK